MKSIWCLFCFTFLDLDFKPRLTSERNVETKKDSGLLRSFCRGNPAGLGVVWLLHKRLPWQEISETLTFKAFGRLMGVGSHGGGCF